MIHSGSMIDPVIANALSGFGINFTKTEDNLTVGDTVIWRGGFGKNEPQKVKVIKIGIGSMHNNKLVSSIPLKDLKHTVVYFDNGSWDYGDMIKKV